MSMCNKSTGQIFRGYYTVYLALATLDIFFILVTKLLIG